MLGYVRVLQKHIELIPATLHVAHFNIIYVLYSNLNKIIVSYIVEINLL